jgi:hypothetical protein
MCTKPFAMDATLPWFCFLPPFSFILHVHLFCHSSLELPVCGDLSLPTTEPSNLIAEFLSFLIAVSQSSSLELSSTNQLWILSTIIALMGQIDTNVGQPSKHGCCKILTEMAWEVFYWLAWLQWKWGGKQMIPRLSVNSRRFSVSPVRSLLCFLT